REDVLGLRERRLAQEREVMEVLERRPRGDPGRRREGGDGIAREQVSSLAMVSVEERELPFGVDPDHECLPTGLPARVPARSPSSPRLDSAAARSYPLAS